MMGFKLTKRSSEKLNACSSLGELPKEAVDTAKLLTFEVEEFVIEHFRGKN